MSVCLALGKLNITVLRQKMGCAGARQLPRELGHGQFTEAAKARLSNDGQRFVCHQTDAAFLRYSEESPLPSVTSGRIQTCELKRVDDGTLRKIVEEVLRRVQERVVFVRLTDCRPLYSHGITSANPEIEHIEELSFHSNLHGVGARGKR